MKKSSAGSSEAAQLITNQIAEFSDWRGKTLARLRKLILDAVPDMTEEWKWGTAVWTNQGLVCSAAVFKGHVKLQFFKGAELEDPQGLFNTGTDAKAMRSIDFGEGDQVDETALKALIRAAVTFNQSVKTKK